MFIYAHKLGRTRRLTTETANTQLESRLRIRLVQLNGSLQKLAVKLTIVCIWHFGLASADTVEACRETTFQQRERRHRFGLEVRCRSRKDEHHDEQRD